MRGGTAQPDIATVLVHLGGADQGLTGTIHQHRTVKHRMGVELNTRDAVRLVKVDDGVATPSDK